MNNTIKEIISKINQYANAYSSGYDQDYEPVSSYVLNIELGNIFFHRKPKLIGYGLHETFPIDYIELPIELVKELGLKAKLEKENKVKRIFELKEKIESSQEFIELKN